MPHQLDNSSPNSLEFSVDRLEERQMLAADVDIVGGGESLRIRGDDSSDIVLVSTNEAGNVVVSDGVTTQDTGLTELKNLTINTGGGADAVVIAGTGSNAVRVTGRTSINLGNDTNVLSLSGVHERLRIVGGRGSDIVDVSVGIRLAKANVNLRSGEDLFAFDAKTSGDAFNDGRLTVADVDTITSAPERLSVNMGSGDDVVALLDDGEFFSGPLDEQDQRIFGSQATYNGGSGIDTMSPLGLAPGVDSFGRVRSFELNKDLGNTGDNLPTPLGADAVFNESYYDSMIGQVVAGAGTQTLIDSMQVLAGTFGTPTQAETDLALGNIASVRGLTTAQVQAQFERFVQLRDEAVTTGQANNQEALEPLSLFHFDFMGSNEQLRYGKIVGDVVGLDAVFGALLNPTGGLVGPGNVSVNLGDHPVGYHGAVHDAAGYLFNFLNIGPGYDYLGNEAIFATSDPLAGQTGGVAFWYGKLGQPDNFADDIIGFLLTDDITGIINLFL